MLHGAVQHATAHHPAVDAHGVNVVTDDHGGDDPLRSKGIVVREHPDVRAALVELPQVAGGIPSRREVELIGLLEQLLDAGDVGVGEGRHRDPDVDVTKKLVERVDARPADRAAVSGLPPNGAAPNPRPKASRC